MCSGVVAFQVQLQTTTRCRLLHAGSGLGIRPDFRLHSRVWLGGIRVHFRCYDMCLTLEKGPYLPGNKIRDVYVVARCCHSNYVFTHFESAHAQRRVFAIMPLPVGLALATSLGPTPSVNYRRTTLQAMRMLFMIVGVLAVLWAPYTIVKIIDLQTGGNVPFALLRTCAWISLLSSAVNPIIFLNNKKYSSRFKALLCSCTPARGHSNRVWPAEGNTATQHTLSTAVPSFADFPSTSGLFTPRLKKKNTSFIGSNLNTLEIPPLKSAASVPIIKFNPPIVTITPSTPVHEGKGKVSAKSPAKTVDAIIGLNVKAEIPTTPVHSMKYTKKDPLGDIEHLYDIKFF